MKIDGVASYYQALGSSAAQQPSPETQAPKAEAVREEEKAADEAMLEQLEEELEKKAKAYTGFFKEYDVSGSKNDVFEVKNSKPKDSSSQLTRRLVSAGGQFEVRQIMSDAMTDLVSLRMIAAICKEDAPAARAAIKKLEKLVNRAHSKIKDLDKEDLIRIQKSKAEHKRQQRRAEEIKAELRKKRIARMARENSYLFEDLHDKIFGQIGPGSRRDDVSEAAIAAEAEVIAAAEVAAVSAGSVEAGAAMDTGAGGEISIGGGEASAPEGGEIDLAV